MAMQPITDPNKTARIAGFLYLLLIPLGILGLLYIPNTLFVPGDIATTIDNIQANEFLFRAGIVGAILAQLVNIAVVLYLYKVLAPASKIAGQLMVIFLLLGVPIAFVNELFHSAVLLILNGPNFLSTFSTEQVQSIVALFIDLHAHGIMVAQVFWGLWLFPMGYMVYKSGYLPRFIGILLMIGCFGYLMDSFIFFFVPGFAITVSEFTFLGEVLLPLWLVIKGVNVEGWKKQTQTVAKLEPLAAV
ncbi:MAG: DUF4386 domain-containing protein [Caldilineaceae bacterium]